MLKRRARGRVLWIVKSVLFRRRQEIMLLYGLLRLVVAFASRVDTYRPIIKPEVERNQTQLARQSLFQHDCCFEVFLVPPRAFQMDDDDEFNGAAVLV